MEIEERLGGGDGNHSVKRKETGAVTEKASANQETWRRNNKILWFDSELNT